jgi:hypothetical protein
MFEFFLGWLIGAASAELSRQPQIHFHSYADYLQWAAAEEQKRQQAARVFRLRLCGFLCVCCVVIVGFLWLIAADLHVQQAQQAQQVHRYQSQAQPQPTYTVYSRDPVSQRGYTWQAAHADMRAMLVRGQQRGCDGTWDVLDDQRGVWVCAGTQHK